VDFRYSEEQLALQETLQRFIVRDYDFERRRALARSPLGFSAEAWERYAEFGLLALPFPEKFGGLGGTGVDVLTVMEQVGRGLLLEPFATSVVICGGLIRDVASDAVCESILPQIAAGKVRVALAAHEAAGRYELRHVATSATRGGGSTGSTGASRSASASGSGSGSGWRLNGAKSVVLDAPSADYFLVSARAAGAVADADGISLYLVPRAAPGLTLSGYPTQSGGRAADLRLEDVTVGDDALIGAPERALGSIEKAVDAGIAALCGEALGIVTALNEATLNYLKTRKQFGTPIGAFQALQHRMAEMYIAGEQIRSMAIIAAIHGDSPDAAARRRAVSGAKAYIGQAARFVGQQAVQLHGAMGLVDDLPVGHYFKRLTMIDLTFGDADFHLARFSDSGDVTV
jgi:alkylation response protein AidB-like acyl-CoA dehydrogenase